MARKFPSAPALRRTVETLEPKVELVIACEGTKTEPNYLRSCVAHYGAGLVTLRIVERSGVPLTVVSAAVEEKQKLVASARKLPKNERSSFSVWAVFDKDDHEISEALELATREQIKVALSNPCFELWPVLHLEDYGAQDGRHQLQRRLSGLMPGYRHDDGASINFDQIKELGALAATRARRLNNARELEGCPRGCPSTTVVDLVQKIMENGAYIDRVRASTQAEALPAGSGGRRR